MIYITSAQHRGSARDLFFAPESAAAPNVFSLHAPCLDHIVIVFACDVIGLESNRMLIHIE